MSYDKLFSPGKIGKLETKNRVVMTAMGVGLANLDGTPSADMIAFYEARAKGGTAVIIPEITRINDSTGVGMPMQLSVTGDAHIEPLRKLADAIHRHGSRLIIQLHHPGRQTYSELLGGQKVVAPSAIPCGYCKQETRALETAEVKSLVRDFVNGAVRVRKAGGDGVELHAAHGYLINQFLSPYTNHRTDEYGGSLENRMRFVREIIDGIRETLGGDFPVGVRLSVDELLAANGVSAPYIDLKEGIRIARNLEKAGIDLLNVSCGIYETGMSVVEPVSFKPGWRADFIKAVKGEVGVPVLAVSLIREPELAEKLLDEGVLDFVGLGRPHLADPEWANKAKEGRADEIRKCICCLRCFETVGKNSRNLKPLECALNPRTANELRYGEPRKVASRRRAVVVGAGPAGLAAAEVLQSRGIETTLVDRASRLGGKIEIAHLPPMKEKLNWVPDYYATRLKKLGVDIRLGTDATADYVLDLKPDAVLVSTGGRPIVPRAIKGIGGGNVCSVDDLLEGRRDLRGKTVAVIGAGQTGLEVAEFLCERGSKVSVVEMLEQVAPEAYITNVYDIMGRLQKMDCKLLLGHKLVEVGPEGIVVESNGAQKRLAVDAVVLSLGYRPDSALAEQLRGKVAVVKTIGDSAKIGNIASAVRSGFTTAWELFEPKPFSFYNPDRVLTNEWVMQDQIGVNVAFVTDMDVFRRVLPSPLEPAGLPVMFLTSMHIRKPTFAQDYYESMLMMLARYGDKVGAYPLALVLSGPGAEMGTQTGREFTALHKKICERPECIQIVKDGDRVRTTVDRHGTRLVDLTMRLGAFNHPWANMMYPKPELGAKVPGGAFYFHYSERPDEAGNQVFYDGMLTFNRSEFTYYEWEPGTVTLETRSSVDDPWGEFPVRQVLGGTFSVNDNRLLDNRKLVDLDINAKLPYLLTAKYDHTVFDGEHQDDTPRNVMKGEFL